MACWPASKVITSSFVCWVDTKVYVVDSYFRIGHMGVSVVNEDRGDVEAVVKALGESLDEIYEEKGIKKSEK